MVDRNLCALGRASFFASSMNMKGCTELRPREEVTSTPRASLEVEEGVSIDVSAAHG